MLKDMDYNHKKTSLQLASERLRAQWHRIEELEKELGIHNHYMKVIKQLEQQSPVSMYDPMMELLRLSKDLEYMAYTLERTDTDPLPKDGTCGQTQNERPRNAEDSAAKLNR